MLRSLTKYNGMSGWLMDLELVSLSRNPMEEGRTLIYVDTAFKNMWMTIGLAARGANSRVINLLTCYGSVGTRNSSSAKFHLIGQIERIGKRS